MTEDRGPSGLEKRSEELENSLSIALSVNDTYQRENVKLKKRAQEAEGELSIMKGIETNRVKESQVRSDYLQDELDRVKRENNDLHNKVAALLDAVDPVQKARESGL